MERPTRTGASFNVNLKLLRQEKGQELPTVALYQLDHRGNVEKKLSAAKDGKLTLKEEWSKRGRVLALGPDTKELSELKDIKFYKVRSELVWEKWKKDKAISIPSTIWPGWLFTQVCLSGNVKKCISFELPPFEVPLDSPLPFPPMPVLPYPPISVCLPVCDGIVEIYAHTCCCIGPIIIEPWPPIFDICKRYPELCERIPIDICKRYPQLCDGIPEVPGLPIPRPGPDPLPFSRLEVMSDKRFKRMDARIDKAELKQSISKRVINDLTALLEMPKAEAADFIMARPYLYHLWCNCTETKVGETIIRPGGDFDFCYFKSNLTIFGKSCTTTYSFKVKQWIDNQWVVVYDGVAGHDYFTADEVANLITTNSAAFACHEPEPDVGHDKPFVLFERVGGTQTHRLNSPVQVAEMGINSPLPPNGGLCDPAPSSPPPMGLYDRPWGQVLPLRLLISEEMKGLGAMYYRISKVASDANGNPVGGAIPQPLSSNLSWRKIDYVGGLPVVTADVLGPLSVGAENALFKIPYYADENWLSGQYHQFWNTTSDPNGRYLIIVEVFDNAGNRLKPTGSPAVAAGIAKDFDYLHWKTSDSTNFDVVHQAALTNVLWSDNQPVYSDIEDLRKNGVPNTALCQFIEGNNSDNFSVGFRAYHVNGATDSFMWRYIIDWQKGMSGTWHTLQIGYDNAPVPIDAPSPEQSSVATFGTMLDGAVKCAFTVRLRTYAKHTNGNRRLYEYDRWDHASFALETTPPPLPPAL